MKRKIKATILNSKERIYYVMHQEVIFDLSSCISAYLLHAINWQMTSELLLNRSNKSKFQQFPILLFLLILRVT